MSISGRVDRRIAFARSHAWIKGIVSGPRFETQTVPGTRGMESKEASPRPSGVMNSQRCRAWPGPRRRFVLVAAGAVLLGVIGPGAAVAQDRFTNLILNPGAEQGICVGQTQDLVTIPEWTRAGVLKANVGCYGGSGMATSCSASGGCGANLFWGGPNVCGLCTTELYQTIDLSPGCFGTIDAGHVEARVSGYFGFNVATSQDWAWIVAEFRSDAGVLGSMQVGPFFPAPDQVMEFHQGLSWLPAGTRHIRLRLMFLNGSLGQNQCYLDEVSVMVGCPDPPVSVPGSRVALSLSRPQPNPSNGRMQFSYTLPHDGHVRLAIYGASGRRVRALDEGPRDAGVHAVIWDGLDDARHDAAPGMYWVRLEAEGRALRQMVAVLK